MKWWVGCCPTWVRHVLEFRTCSDNQEDQVEDVEDNYCQKEHLHALENTDQVEVIKLPGQFDIRTAMYRQIVFAPTSYLKPTICIESQDLRLNAFTASAQTKSTTQSSTQYGKVNIQNQTKYNNDTTKTNESVWRNTHLEVGDIHFVLVRRILQLINSTQPRNEKGQFNSDNNYPSVTRLVMTHVCQMPRVTADSHRRPTTASFGR